jgi:O-succinylhomoserine sulfhydrylase
VNNVFAPVIRSAGMTLSPFNAWVVLKGLETLGIRMRAQSANALAFARWLSAQPRIAKVFYPGLESHGQHALAMRQQSGLGGSVLSFELKADNATDAKAKAFAVLNHLNLAKICTNLGDTKTLAAHPATTSHGRLTEAQRAQAGIGQGLIRVSVGLEHVGDLETDFLQALTHAA